MRIGDEAPDFELLDQDGTPRRLSTMLADGPVVLFFYPAAMTAGCTAEACHFRDLAAEFAEVGAQRVGISGDDVSAQKKFADRYTFDYPLLADADGAVAEAYGVRRGALGRLSGLSAKRVTFVIGKDGRVAEMVKNELNMNVHADKALEALRAG